MDRPKALIVAGALAALVAVPGHLDAQQLIGLAGGGLAAFEGGSNFSTSMSVELVYDSGSGEVILDIMNNGGGETFTEIALINIPNGVSVSEGTAPEPWVWDLNSIQSPNDGFPTDMDQEGYRVTTRATKTGLQQGETARFTFAVNPADAFALLENIGVGIHAQGGPEGCSTKFAVWNGGESTNDAGPDYDPDCVPVPEPTSSGLLAVGLAGLVFVATRRRHGLGIDA